MNNSTEFESKKIELNLENKSYENFEEYYYGLKGNDFPKLNMYGQELFDSNDNSPLSEKERLDMIIKLEAKFSEILDIMRISRQDPNSTHTPYRVAKMFVNELFEGRYTKPPKITIFPNRKHVNNLIISQGIEIMSVCSHHWQTISGKCVVGYIPGDFVVGVSKLSRIVQWFSADHKFRKNLESKLQISFKIC